MILSLDLRIGRTERDHEQVRKFDRFYTIIKSASGDRSPAKSKQSIDGNCGIGHRRLHAGTVICIRLGCLF